MHIIIVCIVLLTGAVIDAARQDNCVFDYSPCDCRADDNGHNVTCTNVPIDTIASIFKQTPMGDHRYVRFVGDYLEIPANILSGKRAQNIAVICGGQSKLLHINVDAFGSSRDFTTYFGFDSCDLAGLNLNFLADFTALTTIEVYNGTLSVVQSMPELPSLENVWFYVNQGLEQWYRPEQTPNLKRIDIFDIGATSNGPINNIVDAIIYYANSLTYLDLNGVGLTRIPHQLPLFRQLTTLGLSNNYIPALLAGSVSLAAQVQLVDMQNSSVTFIQPGAFQGDFSMAVIDLEDNYLATLESRVFHDLLQSMTTGSINVKSNPFNCGCNLAWIVRDNRHLLEKVKGGTCRDGTPFEYLDPDTFAQCGDCFKMEL